ncbi:MAG: Stp1/IreP family PP2C-type Ser/Thr phosphatase [Candidatus Palauibacterales bacterium]|nr:Stp1/IreP family PP2C-type Ser/Thr phosphatase [Candidatus Palauibacterales bacterium]
MELQLAHAAATDVGRVRDQNEDAWLALPDSRLFAVADGMGGHAAGEVASRVAVETLAEELGDAPPGEPETARSQLEHAVLAAGRRIHDQSARVPERHGMGTTVTALQFLEAGRTVLAHVGDSRAYRLREGKLRRLTRDHTWVQEQMDRGLMSESGARQHPASSVLTRALGTAPRVSPDLSVVDWRPGDVFLLCSDGLTGPVPDEDIERTLREIPDPQAAAAALVLLANERGGPDNVTAVVVRTGAESPPEDSRTPSS